MIPRRSLPIAWLCIALYAWCSAVLVDGYVLCIGAGGHVALEAATGESCGECTDHAGAPVDPGLPELHDLPDGCDDCFDIALAARPQAPDELRPKAAVDPALAAPPAILVACEPWRLAPLGQPCRAPDGVAGEHRLACQRTVLLRV